MLEEDRKEKDLLCFREEKCDQGSKPFPFWERLWGLFSFSESAQCRIPTNTRDVIISEPRGYSDPKERPVRTLDIS